MTNKLVANIAPTDMEVGFFINNNIAIANNTKLKMMHKIIRNESSPLNIYESCIVTSINRALLDKFKKRMSIKKRAITTRIKKKAICFFLAMIGVQFKFSFDTGHRF